MLGRGIDAGDQRKDTRPGSALVKKNQRHATNKVKVIRLIGVEYNSLINKKVLIVDSESYLYRDNMTSPINRQVMREVDIEELGCAGSDSSVCHLLVSKFMFRIR